ncbi:unnamed protein product [Ambrosiozyma monospora]|uniref:Unnamed protein product n=1 Tax=Ambrosiozyma monospora TaxID=43982 RepID=A0A9W6SZZ1_AMBMO|nr:unnamed protein product [Ambrosiozyma monospora]
MAAVKRINGGSLKLKKLKSNFDSVHRHATTNNTTSNTTNNSNNKQRISVTPTTISRLSTSSSIYSRTAPLNIPSINHQQSQQKLQCPRPQFSYLPSCVSVTEQTETKEKEIESSISASEHNQCQDQDDMSMLVKHPFLCHDSDSSNSDSGLDYSSQYDYDEGEIKSETKAINDRSYSDRSHVVL